MRRIRLAAIWCGLAVLLLMPTNVAAQNSRTFPETGRVVQGAFLEFWDAHGGVETLGLPLSPVYLNRNDNLRQIFERAILEWHPENDQPNRVQLFRMGDALLDNTIGRTDAQGKFQPNGAMYRTVAPRACPASSSSCRTFTETRHTVRGAFYAFWRDRGELELFGYPITEETTLTSLDGGRYVMQYFEKVRLEYHPEIGGGTVLVGRLGARIWDDVRDTISEDGPPIFVPPYSSTLPYQTR